MLGEIGAPASTCGVNYVKTRDDDRKHKLNDLPCQMVRLMYRYTYHVARTGYHVGSTCLMWCTALPKSCRPGMQWPKVSPWSSNQPSSNHHLPATYSYLYHVWVEGPVADASNALR